MALIGLWDKDAVGGVQWFDQTRQAVGWWDEIILGPAGAASYTLTADKGSYTYTGQTATAVEYDRLVSAAQGTYTYSGQTATTLRLSMPAAQGSYSYTGQTATALKW